ncbi:hypothetical protein B7494_g4031 [Chlorociboria aeruginascens]|nr:hypothetical protein B7494_g4031 [Chlorociboria aeruginascens]
MHHFQISSFLFGDLILNILAATTLTPSIQTGTIANEKRDHKNSGDSKNNSPDDSGTPTPSTSTTIDNSTSTPVSVLITTSNSKQSSPIQTTVANSGGDCKGTLILTSQAHADQILNCLTSTYTGNIIVTNYNDPNLTLDGLSALLGNLSVTNAPKLTSINVPSLTNLNGSLIVHNLPSFQAFEFPLGCTISNVDLEDLPSFSVLNMDIGGDTGYLKIVNTNLNAVSISATSATDITIEDNESLTNITLSQLQTANSIYISGNSAQTDVSLDQLATVEGIELNGVGSLETSALNTINDGGLTIQNSSASVSMPQLKTIAGVLVISDNELSSLNMPLLESVASVAQSTSSSGYIQITNNTNLKILDFDALQDAGSMTLKGPFENCAALDAVHNNTETKRQNNGNVNTITYTCIAVPPGSTLDQAIHGSSIQASSSGNTSTPEISMSNYSSSDHKKLSSSSIAGIAIGSVAFILLALTGCMLLWLRKQKSSRIPREILPREVFADRYPPLPMGRQGRPQERSPPRIFEVGNSPMLEKGLQSSAPRSYDRDRDVSPESTHRDVSTGGDRPVSPITIAERDMDEPHGT